jgi:hypothetical protein
MTNSTLKTNDFVRNTICAGLAGGGSGGTG